MNHFIILLSYLSRSKINVPTHMHAYTYTLTYSEQRKFLVTWKKPNSTM